MFVPETFMEVSAMNFKVLSSFKKVSFRIWFRVSFNFFFKVPFGIHFGSFMGTLRVSFRVF